MENKPIQSKTDSFRIHSRNHGFALSTMLCAVVILFVLGLGLLAVVPNILGYVGVPDAFCGGWWMNICVFHPVIDSLKSGGLLTGAVIVAGCAVFQYSLLLTAILRARRQ